MIVLHIYGEEYSALSVEQEIGINKAYQDAVSNGGKVTYNTDDFYAECRVHRFTSVDPKFIEFINTHMIDYDRVKHENYYVIKYGEER